MARKSGNDDDHPRLRDRLEGRIFEQIDQRPSGKWAPRLVRIPVSFPILVCLTVVTGWTIFIALASVTGLSVTWWNPGRTSIPADDRGDLIRDTLGVLALFAAILAAIYAYRKQRLEEAAGYRADAEGLFKRYQDASAQLGHGKAAVRLAAVYSLARLADDWPEQRQTCIDVFCAYLRMPWDILSDGSPDEGDSHVRKAIVSIMERHLVTDSRIVSWSDFEFDFTRATFLDLAIGPAVFNHSISFREAEFRGDCVLRDVTFRRTADFSRATVTGSLTLTGAELRPRRTGAERSIVTLDASALNVASGAHAKFAIDYIAQDGVIGANQALISGTLEFVINPQLDAPGRIDLCSITLENSSKLSLHRAPYTPAGSSRISVAEWTARMERMEREYRWPRLDAFGWKLAANSSVFILRQLLDDPGVYPWWQEDRDPSATVEIKHESLVGNSR